MLSHLIAAAAASASQCPAFDTALPAELKAWTALRTVATLTPGLATALKLRPSATTGDRPQQPSSYSGAIPLRITERGTYGIAASHGAWIDITRGKEPALMSARHRHGPACSTIRKIVVFELQPGLYSLQVSNSPVDTLKLLVVRN